MSSGKHRRPEADPLPEVDIAERLAAGHSGNAARTTAPVASTPASLTVPGQTGRHETGPVPPVPPAGAGAAAAAPGPTVIARQSRAAQRSARRRAARQRIFVVAGGLV